MPQDIVSPSHISYRDAIAAIVAHVPHAVLRPLFSALIDRVAHEQHPETERKGAPLRPNRDF